MKLTNKKSKAKRILGLAVALAMTLSWGAAMAAETVVFDDSFETASALNDNLYLSNPTVKSYGENLIVNGDFETETNFTYASNNTSKPLRSDFPYSGGEVYMARDTSIKRSGEASARMWSNDVDNMNRYVTYKIPASSLEAGVYELEGWFYTEAATRSYMMDVSVFRNKVDNNVDSLTQLAKYGSEMGGVTLVPNKWNYIKTTLTFTAQPARDVWVDFTVMNGFVKENNVVMPVYIDDLKLRKVTNAQLSAQELQSGMAVYETANLSGKTAEVTIFAKNDSAAEEKFSVITALYDEEDLFIKLLGIASFTADAGAVRQPYTYTVAVPQVASGSKVVSFVWNNMNNIAPLANSSDASTESYKVIDGVTNHRNGYIPFTNKVWHSNNASSAASYTERLVPGVAKTGVNSLYIHGVSDGTNTTRSMVNFNVTENHTYRISFWTNVRETDGVSNNKYRYFARVNNNTNLNGSALSTYSIPTDKYDVEWVEHTIEFTAAATGYHSLGFYSLTNGKRTNGFVGGCYIDDVTITDLGVAATE